MALTAAQQTELEIATCNAISLNGMCVDPISFVAKPSETAAGALIIANIHKLFCIEIIEPEPTGGGGPYPRPAHNVLAPGEVQNFYKPVDAEWQYAQEPRLYNKKHVILRIRIGDNWNEKEFLIPEKRSKQIIQVLNLFNATRERLNVAVQNIKQYATRAIIKIRNLHKRS